MFQAGAVGAVDFLPGVIPGAVQGDEQLVLERAPAFQVACLIETLEDRVIAGTELFRRDRIEPFPEVMITGDLFQMEQALGVALPLGLLHGFLVSQERGALGEEDRKGGRADVGRELWRSVCRARRPKGARRERSAGK
jgi:hypothetical protein